MRKIFVVVFSFISIFQLVADEGMWLLPLIQKLNYEQMKKMGLNLKAEDIYNINHSSLKDAVVIFNGGCTGEMVSNEGLLFTNHHCGYDAIQTHSSVNHDYLKNGFWAKSKEEELANPGMFVTFLVRMENVTEKIIAVLNDTMKEPERKILISTSSNIVVKEAIKGTTYEAEVKPMFEGNQYYLFVYETYKDVRLVGAPPQSIGKFGGETDNWMWPRHTADFSVFRVYCSADGKPAEYSKDNVPLKPRYFFPISLKDLKKDDFTMVLGYPGNTERYLSSYGVQELAEVVHPVRIKVRTVKQNIMMEDMKKSEKIRIQYASKYTRSANYWKFSMGQERGIQKLKVIEKRQQLEQQFKHWVEADTSRKREFGNVVPLIERAIKSRKELYFSQQYYAEAIFRSIEPTTLVLSFNPLIEEMSKPEPDQQKMKEQIDQLQPACENFFKNYNFDTDFRIAQAMLRLMKEDFQKDYMPDIFNVIKKKYKGNTDAYLNKVYSKSIFSDSIRMKSFLNKPQLKVLKNDPFFIFTQSVYNRYRSIYKVMNLTNDVLNSAERKFVKGLQMMQTDRVFYPDANFTMRLTYGKVGGYSPFDAIHYDYLTTLKGIMEKENPRDEEFVVPFRLKELYRSKDFAPYSATDNMPVCFITDNDITGGNSGSPVVNGDGQLIGIAFDGNWDAMTGDIEYEPTLQKCICVDIRYVLFIIDKFAEANYLLKELSIVQ